MAKLKSYFFASFRETMEVKDATNEGEEETKEGADAPFHRHVTRKKFQLPTCAHTYMSLYLLYVRACVCMCLLKYISGKYVRNIHHVIFQLHNL